MRSPGLPLSKPCNFNVRILHAPSALESTPRLKMSHFVRFKPNKLLRPLLSCSLATATPGAATPSAPPVNPALQVFNRNSKRLQRDRSVLRVDASRRVDYLKDTVAERLVERLMVSFHPTPAAFIVTILMQCCLKHSELRVTPPLGHQADIFQCPRSWCRSGAYC